MAVFWACHDGVTLTQISVYTYIMHNNLPVRKIMQAMCIEYAKKRGARLFEMHHSFLCLFIGMDFRIFIHKFVILLGAMYACISLKASAPADMI